LKSLPSYYHFFVFILLSFSSFSFVLLLFIKGTYLKKKSPPVPPAAAPSATNNSSPSKKQKVASKSNLPVLIPTTIMPAPYMPPFSPIQPPRDDVPFSSPGASVANSVGLVGVAEAWLQSPSCFGVETVNVLEDGIHQGQRTSIHHRFMVDSLCTDASYSAYWAEGSNRILNLERCVPTFLANPNNQDDYVIDETTNRPMYPRTHPLLGSMATSQQAKKVDGEVNSPGRIVYEQEMDPNSVVFYLQPLDVSIAGINAQFLIVVCDVYVPKEDKKGRIKAKKRTAVARVTLGTLVEDTLAEDFEMLDATGTGSAAATGTSTTAGAGTTVSPGDTDTAAGTGTGTNAGDAAAARAATNLCAATRSYERGRSPTRSHSPRKSKRNKRKSSNQPASAPTSPSGITQDEDFNPMM
jgi:hypothetical protein